jgi:predicted GIY-YIG superfamily endonuclease
MEINNNYINIDISSLNCIGDNRCREKTIIKYPIIIGIYKITSENGAIYIGLSNDIYQRLYKYKKLRCKLQLKLYNSLIKYGVESHKFEIIHTIKKDNLEKKEIYQKLRDLEIYYIKKFNSFYGDNDKFGLNLTRGGDLMELTQESRNLIKIKNKGRIVSEGGRRIKEIGSMSRKELETATNRKVFLDLQVESDKHWITNFS